MPKTKGELEKMKMERWVVLLDKEDKSWIKKTGKKELGLRPQAFLRLLIERAKNADLTQLKQEAAKASVVHELIKIQVAREKLTKRENELKAQANKKVKRSVGRPRTRNQVALAAA